MRGSVAGIYLFEKSRIPKRSQGVSHNIPTSHAHPLRKLRINLLHCFLSSCFPKSIPTSQSAIPPPTVMMIENGINTKNAPMPIHDPSTHQSQIFAEKRMKKKRAIGLEFFCGAKCFKKRSDICQD